MKFNIQNGNLLWLIRRQNFDFQIALTFLCYIRFGLRFLQIIWFNKGLHFKSCTINDAVPFISYFKINLVLKVPIEGIEKYLTHWFRYTKCLSVQLLKYFLPNQF